MNQTNEAVQTPPTAPEETKAARPKILKSLFRRKQAANLRTVIADFIEKKDDDTENDHHHDAQESELIANILALRDLTAFDVMVPRAEIASIPHDITRDQIIDFVAKNPLSRFPVYKDTLDDIVGTVHIKDLFLAMAPNDACFSLDLIIRDVSIISPALPVMDILLNMRKSKRHMVMVVDEYGGIDGLVTAGDIIEAIIGRLDDEHDTDADPQFVINDNGTIFADAKVAIEDFEKQLGPVLSEDERDEIDTLGGLVMSLAGRIPTRGEVLIHDSGLEFEVLDADPRRVISLLIRQPKTAL